MEQKTKLLQWHPAFYAGVWIEFVLEVCNVYMENEHQLGTKPKEIDMLIIKKNSEEPIEKNIGRIFRKYNIMEYKSPDDYLSIDDFYKVYGYACFYKSDTTSIDSIKAEEITISFVCKTLPKKLVAHLEEERQFKVSLYEEGIYYIMGDVFPMQLIITSELTNEKNFWLHNLTNDLEDPDTIENLALEYQKHRDEKMYQSVMNVIVQANREKFEEEKDMCDALREIFADDFAKCQKQGMELGLQEGRQQGIQRGIQQGIQSLVEACKSLGGTRDVTRNMLREKFEVTDEAAEQYMKLYW